MLSGLYCCSLSNLYFLPSQVIKMRCGVSSASTPNSFATYLKSPVPSSRLEMAVMTCKWLPSTNLAKEPKARLSACSLPRSSRKPPFLCLNTCSIVLLSSGISYPSESTAKQTRSSDLFGEKNIFGNNITAQTLGYFQWLHQTPWTIEQKNSLQSWFPQRVRMEFRRSTYLIVQTADAKFAYWLVGDTITNDRSDDLLLTQSCNVAILKSTQYLVTISRAQIVILANCRSMKFLLEPADRSGKQMRSEHRQVHDRCFQNILSPCSKVQCDLCKLEISKAAKILSLETDYCASCFANLDQYPPEYQVLNKLDFPLFERGWTAEEELLLLEGLQKHGFGNWAEIADSIGTNKTREDLEQHFYNTYLSNQGFLPNLPLLTKRDKQGRLYTTHKDTRTEKGHSDKQPAPATSQRAFHIDAAERGALAAHQPSETSSPAEIIGYMPKRGDFEVQYDNDAQLLLAEMEFTDQDTQEDRAMKFRLIDTYNQKLSERGRRKEFVIARGLLDLREQIRLDRTRSKEQKEVYNMMKVFARFNQVQDHEKLVQALIKERRLRQRIEELKDFQRRGFTNLAQLEAELAGRRKKEDKAERRQDKAERTEFLSRGKVSRPQNKSGRLRKDRGDQEESNELRKEEVALCGKLELSQERYLLIKETILRESALQGLLPKDYFYQMFKLEHTIIQPILDLLVATQKIPLSQHTRN